MRASKGLYLLGMCFLIACEAAPEAGGAAIGVSMRGLSAADVSRVTVTISGPGIAPAITQDLVLTQGQFGGVVGGIPAGADRAFAVEALDGSGSVVYSAMVTGVTIVAGATIALVVPLQQSTPPSPFSNSVPVISALVASANAVPPGGAVRLAVTASDPDAGDTLSYSWSAASGSFDDASSTSPVWTAPPAEGAVSLSVTVSDGKGGSSALTLLADVQQDFGEGSAEVQVSFNTWPDVAEVAAAPGRVDVGQTVALDLTASDADGHALSVTWSDGGGECAGSFSDIAAEDPGWTAPALPPAAGRCTLTVTVDDGNGGSNTGSATIEIGPPTEVNLAPQIGTTFASRRYVNAGDTVVLRVAAEDPEGQPISFAWSASEGSVAPPTTTASTSEVVWTAASGCHATVIVEVDDADGARATHSFALGAREQWNGVDDDCDGLIDEDLVVEASITTFRSWETAVDDPAIAAFSDGTLLLAGNGNGVATTVAANGTVLDPAFPAWGARPAIWTETGEAREMTVGWFENVYAHWSDGSLAWSWIQLGCCNFSRGNVAIDALSGLGYISANGELFTIELGNTTAPGGPNYYGTSSGPVSISDSDTLYVAHVGWQGTTGAVARWERDPVTLAWSTAWTHTVDAGHGLRPAAVAADGSVVVSSSGAPSGYYPTLAPGRLARIQTDGTEVFNEQIGAVTPPVIGASGTIYVGTQFTLADAGPGAIAAYDPSGNELWSMAVQGQPRDLAVGDDGVLYAITGAGKVYGLDQGSGALRMRLSDLQSTRQLILRAGTAYAAGDGVLTAFPVAGVSHDINADGYDPASAWPVRRHDNQRTNSAQSALNL